MNNNEKSNILIIDDNTKNIQLAANVLKSTNRYNIFFATSGKKGIEQLQLRPYTLILLDINMPELDGYETADIIKKDEEYKKIPIIFLSANADKNSIRKGFEHASEDYITKPFDEMELIHRVKTHVELFLAKEKLEKEVDDTKMLLEQYKKVVDISSIVSKTDTSGIITYVNDNFCKISQYSKEELIGKNHNIVRSNNMKKHIFKEMWETIKSKIIWNGIIENSAKDGSSYFANSTIMPIMNSDNEIVEYISLRTDITKEIKFNEDIISTQSEVLSTLGELGEYRSKETGDHVKRVALFSELLARLYECSDEEVSLLKMASPMHDIGKIIISDAILLKPDKLTKDEFDIMKNHTKYGWDIFKKSKNQILKVAAIIAHEHHEKWDGTGYPRGLKGEDIHIYGRITSLVDVFDALMHKRCYKEAWRLDEAMSYIKLESGKSFDPSLVDLFCDNIDEFLEIKAQYNK
ncbi:MAG: response regulator [Campylobacterota bacterium]|nr:response regulator [Campylobacterota bacterium]